MTRIFTDIFDTVVQQNPAHTALLTDGTHALSYRALQTRARALASALPKGESGRIVAISIAKSADYIAALLACWYAGAAFMPLDPALPPARRAHMLREAKPVAILSIGTCSDAGDAPVIDIAADIATVNITAEQGTARLSPNVTAYVIYTSGSTGQPKGVVVTHRALTSVLLQQIDLFKLSRASRSLFYLATGFDASVSDIGTALLAGATLCIESGDKLEIAANLPAVVAARGITYADLPPALLQLVNPTAMPACLETICIGGEACPPAVVRRWAQTRRIVCVYGPTEATICTSASVCDAQSWQQPLIGTPLAGIHYLICDRNLVPGADGELLISGAALADGYLARADLTAQKFIIINGTRWYRTGDHVRRDGQDIVFIGRIDRQFKWRGQLVEPEEIEQALRHIAGISRAFVLRQKLHGHEQLVAHIECSSHPASDTLRNTLAAQLPAWMVPTSFIYHTRMPLTATGKINSAAFILTGSATPAHDSAAFVAATAQEDTLLHCWQTVLGRTVVPADVPFATLGGDSFAVLRLLLAADARGLPLSADFITRHPTLRRQARNLYSMSAHSDAMTSDELRETLAQNFPPPLCNAATPQTVAHILMTGASGFLGRRLLGLLLARTDWTLHLLMRDQDRAAALNRLGLDAAARRRVNIVTGDASLENLGLDRDIWDNLAQTVDSIIHCAAVVNMALSYDTLMDANVRATHSLLLLAAQGKGKTFHHASTLSVFVGSDRNTGTALENDNLDTAQSIFGGYAQSKWAAEELIRQATCSGTPTTVYRLGLVTGDSTDGASSSHDFLRIFMQGMITLSCIPAGSHDSLLVDATPVDYATDMMATCITAQAQGTFHIANRRGFSLAQIIAALARAGHSIDSVDAAQWQAHLDRRVAERPLTVEESAAVMALCRLLGDAAFARHRAMDMFQATGIIFDMTQIKTVLGVQWREPPVADDALLDLYVRGFDLRPLAAKKSASA